MATTKLTLSLQEITTGQGTKMQTKGNHDDIGPLEGNTPKHTQFE